jgi:hypothetical protein
MSWRAQNRFKDAKTPSQSPAMSRNPKPELCGIQLYTGCKACANAASSTLFVIPAYHDIPIWNHVHYRSEVFDSSPPRKRWVHYWIADFLSRSRHDGPISVNTTQDLVCICLAFRCVSITNLPPLFFSNSRCCCIPATTCTTTTDTPFPGVGMCYSIPTLDLRTTGSGSGPDAQDLRSLKGPLAMSTVFASRKPSHSRSALLLETLLSTGLHFGGNITWSGIRRDLPLNAVYVKFSVYTGY